MRRRHLLALCGAALAGCGSRTGDTPPTDTEQSPTEPTPTSERTETRTETGTPTGGPVTVEDLVARKAVTYESLMGSGGVLAERGRQYVVGSVVSDRELSADEFAFEADGRSWSPGLPDTAGGLSASVAGREGSRVGRGPGAGVRSYVAFAVPSPLRADRAQVRYTGAASATFPLPDAAVATLAAPEPRFELVDLTVPESVEQGQSLDVSLTARNASAVDGRFLAAVYWPTNRIADDDESHRVVRRVAAGEKTTASLSLDTEYTAYESGPVPLTVRGHVGAERSVRVTGVDR